MLPARREKLRRVSGQRLSRYPRQVTTVLRMWEVLAAQKDAEEAVEEAGHVNVANAVAALVLFQCVKFCCNHGHGSEAA